MVEDTYKTILKKSEGLYKDKGSRFISYAYPVESETAAKAIIQEIKKNHHSARHHCYAWRIGTDVIKSRANDDGEPSSTAGKPILGQLTSAGITNTLIIVVRYFGGILLGASGLINAYKTAAADAIANADIIELIISVRFELTFAYNELNHVMQIVKSENLQIQSTQFSEICSLVITARKRDSLKTHRLFDTIYGLKIKTLQ